MVAFTFPKSPYAPGNRIEYQAPEFWRLDVSQTDLQKEDNAEMPALTILPNRQYSEGPVRDFEWFRQAKYLARVDNVGSQTLIRQSHRLSIHTMFDAPCSNSKHSGNVDYSAISNGH
jgi:hypothetical protein